MPTRFVSAFLLAALVASCSDEKPDQRLVQNEQSAAARDQRPVEDNRRQRTLGQGESDRIYNQGGLR
jgi:hypothetical protein